MLGGIFDEASQPTVSAPLASEPNKNPVPIQATETVSLAPDGTTQQAPPVEIEKEELGPSQVVEEASASALVPGQTTKVAVTYVHDGDTFNFEGPQGDQGTCRIDLIDAPERANRHSGQGDQPYGPEATQFLRELIGNRQVEIRVAPNRSKDRYVCQVELEGKDVSLELVKAGLAWVVDHYAKDSPRGQALYEAQSGARLEQRGLWADPNPINPYRWRNPNRN